MRARRAVERVAERAFVVSRARASATPSRASSGTSTSASNGRDGAPAFSASSKPRSLESAAPSEVEDIPETSRRGWRRFALALGGYFSRESRYVRGGERLYAEVKRATSADALYRAHELERTFRSDHAMTCLHVWMCLQRLRKEGPDGKEFSQIFYDAFQADVERRVHDEGVRVRVRKWLQDLERTFYGNAVSYDKGLELGGSELSKALHRNVYDGEGDVDRARALERYVRHQLASLGITPTEAIVDGRVRFHGFED